MKRIFKLTLIILFLIFSQQGQIAVFAQSLSSSELINHAKEYDGKLVVYSGEVIGV